MEKIILTGGGTAGHIMPNLALLPFLTDKFEIHYVGCPNSMEFELLQKEPSVTFHAIDAVKLKRSLTLKNLAIPFRLLSSITQAKKLLKELKPKAVFSKGGFAALPICLALDKDTPLIIHESDFSLGLANKLVAKKSLHICCSFETLSKKLKNGLFTGAPLRQAIYQGDKIKAENECGLKKPSNKKNLLVFGGSLGAKAINSAIEKNLNELTKKYNIVHIVGKNNLNEPICAPHYFAIPFSTHIADYFMWADTVITRGGANALFELAALKKPSLVIPLPKAASRGDQLDNAEYFSNLGFFEVLNQEQLSFDNSLLTALEALEKSRANHINAMQNAQNIDGTKKIANLLTSLALS